MKKSLKILMVMFVAVFVFNTCFTTISLIMPSISGGKVISYASGMDVTEPEITVIPPASLKITDRYLTFSARVTDDNALHSLDPVVCWYRADEALPYQKIVLKKEDGTDIYSAEVDTYVQYGTAKENKKFFTDKVFYYIQATDAEGNVAKTNVNIVKCDQYFGETADYNKVPYLLITEMVVSTSQKGIGNGDKFEFLEIYNNSDSDIDFSGYELHYMTAPSVRPTEYALRNPENRNLIIKPKSTIIIWVNTNDWQNKGALPPQEMLEFYYGTAETPKTDRNLPADFEFTVEGEGANLSYTHFAGQPNSGQHRGWGVYTNTGELVVEAYYNVNNDTNNNTDVSSDMGILFRYPVDGGKRMQKISANTVYGSPGRVLNYQVPAATVDMPEDNEDPIINYNHKNVDIFSVESDGLSHEIWASVTDDTIINTVYIEYKISSLDYESEYTTFQSFLRDGETSFYCAYLDFGKFIRQTAIRFRIEARDIVGKTSRTGWYSLNIIPYEDPSSNDPIRTNIENGDYVRGKVTLSATNGKGLADAVSMSLDGELVNCQPDSERYALLVYEVTSTDFNFKNGVTIKNKALDDDNIILFNFDISGGWTTYTVRIPLDMILPSEENPAGGLIGLHSGNRYTPVFDNERFLKAIDKYNVAKAANDAQSMAEAKKDFIYGDNLSKKSYEQELNEAGLNLNRDDYEFRNVRLILADGTVLYDTNPANEAKFSETNYDEIFKLGDGSASDIRQYYFRFDIPSSQINTQSYRIDTNLLTDGKHTLHVTNGTESKTVTFYVDNIAPQFEFAFEDSEILKGLLNLSPIITEDGSGVGKSYGYLDGNRVGIPYYTRSGDLDPGLHTLVVTIEDKVGNFTTHAITFITEQENPLPPLVSEENKKFEGADAQLSVTVKDPSDDTLKVEFFEGYKYSADNPQIFKGYFNSVDMEPIPYVVYPGETEFTAEQYNLIKKVDGSYYDSQSYKLPYHRFEVSVDSKLPRNGTVDVRWYGKSLAGRKVTLYAWNIIEEEWTALDYLIAGEDDFMLEGTLVIETFVNFKDSVVNILVQDEIEELNNEKFTFAWVTDQQYYTQRNAYDDEDNILMELQHNWLIENKDIYNIKYVFSTGDVVNRKYEPYQWDIVDEYYRLLENARIPYGLAAGNHDVDFSLEDYSKFSEVFGEERFKNKPWYGESYQNNRGHYDTISVNGVDFMMVYMGWGIYEPEIKWMNKVISENPDKTVILNFHEFLGTNGVRTMIGEDIYEKVVLPNKNVKMVLSGHLHGSASRVDEIDDDNDGNADRKVWQLLADYQGLKNTASSYDGGNGFMRLFSFDIATGEIEVTAISPWLCYLNSLKGLNEGDEGYYDPHKGFDNLDFDGLRGDGLVQNGNGAGSAYKSINSANNSFVYQWDMTPQIKRVATDAVFVFYRTEEPLGTIENVRSGDTVNFDWKGLNSDSTYNWYVVVTDENGGKYISDMYTFTTGTAQESPSFVKSLIVGSSIIVLLGAGIAVFMFRKKSKDKAGEEL